MSVRIGDCTLYRADCLEAMPTLADGSVDMVLADLPYGTTACKWDSVIPFEPLWKQYRRVAKHCAPMVLTASQPFTSVMVTSNIHEFKYEWVWKKNAGSGFASAKYQPMRYHESVLVFCRSRSVYNPQATPRHSAASVAANVRPIKSSANKSNHTRMASVWKQYDQHTKGPESVLPIDSAPNAGGGKLHPTQKPVALMEYLIRTYTNEGDTVLDNTMGSGTTGVACVNTGRKFYGIEMDEGYFEIACKRIHEAQKQPDIFTARNEQAVA